VLGPVVTAAIVIVVAEIPGLAGHDRASAATANDAAGQNHAFPPLPQSLVFSAIAAGCCLSSLHDVQSHQKSGGEMLTARGQVASLLKKPASLRFDSVAVEVRLADRVILTACTRLSASKVDALVQPGD
jgi:hypothetical protein